ncbi:TIGR03086 family metal-binding protein [Amycolatopsis sp. NPDC049253]|uniref:TIGR03086 family metal-binding protein n=1 Tax=Amycolatopsis sp. NPDC049253 TaxID=3155274 RepID=UPI003415D07B
MDADADRVTDLANVLDEVGRLIDSLREQQWSARTPCDDWDVRALVDHLLDLQRTFQSNLTGQTVPPISDYRSSVAALIAAFQADGALQRTVPDRLGDISGLTSLNILITEHLAHGWDLARAIGVTPSFDETVTNRAIEFARALGPTLPPQLRRFKDSRPVADDAPAIDRLAALLGRTVTT